MWAECPHASTQIRRKVNSAGQPMYAHQCVTCGDTRSGWIPKSQWPAAAPLWDEELSRSYWAQRQERNLRAVMAEQAEREAERADEDIAWWAKYDAHIGSIKWRHIANKVRQREGGRCQGCGEHAPYGHCHHKDYTRMGAEMLFDLLWLCAACHQKMHPNRELNHEPR